MVACAETRDHILSAFDRHISEVLRCAVTTAARGACPRPVTIG